LKAQIFRYKVNRSMKRLLLVGNGSPFPVVAIHINKVFKPNDAEQILKVLESWA